MKKLLLLFGLSLFICQSNAQNQEPITFVNGKFYQGDVKLRNGTLKKVVKPVPAAYQVLKSGTSRKTWGLILTGLSYTCMTTGAVQLVGVTDKIYDSNGDALKSTLFGLVLAFPSVLLVKSGVKRIGKGCDIYNSSLSSGSAPNAFSVNLGLSNHGVGLTVRF